MNQHQKDVLEFHRMFGLTIGESPAFPSTKDVELRANLIDEEALEFRQACAEGDVVKVADALADLLYVVYGAGVTFGIDLEPVFSEVQRSNLTKVWPDGTVHKRVDGKIEKPPSYSKANVGKVLSELGWNKVQKDVRSAGKIEILHPKP
jgi:predicted HAD superfamily Cof-like phosphohydrolase